MKPPWRPNYSTDEVKALIEDYAEWVEYRDRVFILVRLMDVEQACSALRPKEGQAVLLLGLFGYTAESAGALLGVSADAMWKRYQRGIERIVSYLNGGS